MYTFAINVKKNSGQNKNKCILLLIKRIMQHACTFITFLNY